MKKEWLLVVILSGILFILLWVICFTPAFAYTEEDVEELAQLIMDEGSILPMEGKQGIGEVALNRVDSPDFPDNLHDVIYQKNAFCTTHKWPPNEECYEAARTALEYRAFPRDMLYFRTDQVDYGVFYMKIGNTFFSTIRDYKVGGYE